jgi:hypothetical protein
MLKDFSITTKQKYFNLWGGFNETGNLVCTYHGCYRKTLISDKEGEDADGGWRAWNTCKIEKFKNFKSENLVVLCMECYNKRIKTKA